MRPLFVVALVALVGCAEGSDASGIDGVAPAADPGAALPPAQPLSLACRSDAFCEDFESADPTSRWTAAAGQGITFVAPSASSGARSMRIAAGAGAAPAYLSIDGGPQGASFSASLAFAVRLDRAPAARIAGPVVVVGDARIAVELRPRGVVLAQHMIGACDPPTCRVRSDDVSDVRAVTPGVWHRIVLAFEVDAGAAAPYGHVAIGVDGEDLVDVDVTVPLFAGASELHAGVTIADEAPFGLNLDDVMFLSKP
jgi:hypothetical protein